MIKSRAKKVLNIISIFMFSTYAIGFISPNRYNLKRPILLSVLVLSYVLAFYLGGKLSLNKYKWVYPEDDQTQRHGSSKSLGFLQSSIVILLIYTLSITVSNMAATGASNISQAILMAFSNADKVYYSRAGLESSWVMNYITILGSPIFIYASLFGLIKFRELKRPYKICYVLYVAFEAVRWILVGTNKGLFDLLILAVSAVMLSNAIYGKKKSSKISNGNFKRNFIIAIAIIFVLYFFSLTMRSRLGSLYYNLSDTYYRTYNMDHIMFKILPFDLVLIFAKLVDYLAQGYYGLSLGLTLDFQPTYLAGSNVFLTGYIEPLIGIDVSSRLYQTRIENMYGWGATSRWHTMYLWMANDFSFVGVIFVMFLLGYILGKCLYDSIIKKDTFAICLCYMLLKTMFYASANNQVLGTYTIVSFVFFFIMWKLNKKYTFVFGVNGNRKRRGEKLLNDYVCR